MSIGKPPRNARRTGHVRPALLLIVPLVAAGCRTVAMGVNERADALLADYRQRARTTFAPPEASEEPWRPGQFTVHALTDEDGVVLERVAISRRSSPDRLLVSIDRLGVGEQLRVRLTLNAQPRDRATFEAAVTEAWVQRDEQPEIHHLGAVPPDVLALGWRAIARPKAEGSPRRLEVPAGIFPGCVGGVHPAVPLSGVVEASADGVQRELLEFGDDDGGALY